MLHGLESLYLWSDDEDWLNRCIQHGLSDIQISCGLGDISEQAALRYCLEHSNVSRKTGIRSLHLHETVFPSDSFKTLVEVTTLLLA